LYHLKCVSDFARGESWVYTTKHNRSKFFSRYKQISFELKT
jgi:hypothetical protein